MLYLNRLQQMAIGAALSVAVGTPFAIAFSTVRNDALSATPVAQATFPDISGNRYQSEIQRAAALGFVAGENGRFNPNDTVTREQAVSIILEALGVTDAQLGSSANPFADVPSNRWSAEKIAYAAANGIVAGRNSTTFDPAATVTRAELMAMLRKVAENQFSGRQRRSAQAFTDPAHWATRTIAFMASYCGVASPLNEQGTRFFPNQGATRAYTAAAIVRLHDCPRVAVTPRPSTLSGPGSQQQSLPGAARILNLNEPSGLSLQKRGGRQPAVDVGDQIEDREFLSVNDAGSWAAFAVVGGGDEYEGFYLKTNGEGKYSFRCTVRGNFVIGWSSLTAAACSPGGQGRKVLKLDISSDGRVSELAKPGEAIAASLQAKQASGRPDFLNIEASAQPTLIQTIANDAFTAFAVQVLQGEVTVTPEGPNQDLGQGFIVREGQEFVYGGGAISDQNVRAIDVAAEAASCGVLQALNPVQAVSPEVPRDLNLAVMAHLAQHKTDLGVLGSPATLSRFEQRIVDEINLARTNPQQYAQFLTVQDVRTDVIVLEGGVTLPVTEGQSAYEEAIAFLNGAEPLPPFATSAGLSQAAQDLVDEQGVTGATGRGSGENSMENRFNRYGLVGCGQATDTAYYGEQSARGIVVSLIVDDGAPNRVNRAHIFSPQFQVTGVACGPHPQRDEVCSIAYSGAYIER